MWLRLVLSFTSSIRKCNTWDSFYSILSVWETIINTLRLTRGTIFVRFRASGKSLGDIAKSLVRNKSTISRELKRNRSSVYNYYCSNQAQQRAKKRKQVAGKRDRLKSPDIRRYVIKKLKQDWTPELIAGKLPLDHPGLNISYEAIYQYIYDPKVRKKQDLVSYLPRAHRKRHRKGHTRKHRKSHIPERISIDQRPTYIEKRKQPGHWESDTISSRQSPQAIGTSLERVSRYILLAKHEFNKEVQHLG